MKYRVGLIVALATSCAFVAHPIPSVFAADAFTGYVWKDMSDDGRIALVLGYVSGYRNGHREGCRFAAVQVESSQLQHDCSTAGLKFSKSHNYYASKITAYYEAFPEDRVTAVIWLLEQMADQNDRPLHQIHARFKEQFSPEHQ